MMRMPLALLVAAGLTTGGTVEAQQVLVIDYDSGRVVLDDEWRAFYSGSAIDHERGVLYVHDDEEPQGEYLSNWTPRAPPRADGSVCDLGGQDMQWINNARNGETRHL